MSKALDKWQHAVKACEKEFELWSDLIIVECMVEEEKKEKVTAGGIIIPGDTETKQRSMMTVDDLKSNFVRVIAVGKGYYKEGKDGEEEYTPLNVKPGDIVMLGETSVRWFSIFGEDVDLEQMFNIGLTREGEVHMVFRGQAGYDKFMKELK